MGLKAGLVPMVRPRAVSWPCVIQTENMPPPRIPLVETSMEQTYRKITDQLRVNRQQCTAVFISLISVHHHTATNLGDTEVLGSVVADTFRCQTHGIDDATAVEDGQQVILQGILVAFSPSRMISP